MRKYLYFVLIGITSCLFIVIIVFSKKPFNKNIGYKERVGSIALAAEWLNTKQAIESLIATIELNPTDNKSKLSLAQAYIQEARITGNHAYYDGVALDLLDEVIEIEENNFDALCCKSTVLLSQHHFLEGLDVAKKALPINPNNAFIYGLMCDAYVELGDYTAAIKMADKMVSVRPDIRSYARVSYLREIHGDIKGAIYAAKLAVSAGFPGLEQTEWTRIILAQLYESIGSLDSASYHYKTALNNRPDYAYALAGLGKIEKAKGNYKQAIQYYETAKSHIIEYSFSDELTDLYKLNNETEKANKNAQQVIDMLNPISNLNETANNHGHYADKEIAYAYLKINDNSNALKHALIEYQRRPNNIDVAETLAWAYYHNKEYKKANFYIKTALRTNSKNPTLLLRSGIIKYKNGENNIGEALITKALNQNPYTDVELRTEALKYVKI